MNKTFLQRIFGISADKKAQDETVTFSEYLQALKYLPQFLAMVWQTQPIKLAASFLLRILTALLSPAKLYIAKLIIDEVLQIIQTKNTDYQQLWYYVAIEIALVLLGEILLRYINLLESLLGDLLANESSIRLMQHAALLDLEQFEDATFYDKLDRARKTTVGRTFLFVNLFAQFQDIISLVVLAGALLVFNPYLLVVLVLSVIPAFISETYFNRQDYSLARSWTPERRELDYLRLVAASDETAKEIKIFALSDFLINRFKHLSIKYYEINKVLIIRRAFWGTLLMILGNLCYYAAFILIILQTLAGAISVGDLTFLSASFSRLQGNFQSILLRFSQIAQSSLYLRDLFEFLAIQPQITNTPNPIKTPTKISKGFVFENVGFKYPNAEKWAIRHLNFSLQAGEKLALVGENGAGKTTLVKLLARLYDCTEGRILLDGIDIKEYNLQELRLLIGVIFQDFVRFQLNISDNIAVGKIEERENSSKIENAAKLSLADSVVAKFPQGYAQLLGKRFSQKGIELSGGEWQKVALARAYMREAQVLILDEPTAALDARAEFEVFQRFAELTKDKSAVLISHRFSTVRMADRIMVLQNGQAVELGSHEELIAKNGIYAELFNLQAQGYQ
jgi:ATP-binding cassette subfamily B protein